MYLADGRGTIDARTNFTADLASLIRSLQHDTSAIIIMGDFNLNLRDPKLRLAKVLDELNMLDVHRYKFPDLAPVRTCTTGQHQIDYIYASSNILSYVVHAGIEAFKDHVDSDHRASS